MIVRLTNLTAAALPVPWPFDVTLAAGGFRDFPIHVRDIVEYRNNPARTDWLKETEHLLKEGKLSITSVGPVPNDRDLEEMLLALAGGSFVQSGVVPCAGLAIVPVAFLSPMPGVNYLVELELDGPDTTFIIIPAKTPNGFLVTFLSGAYPGTRIIWRATYLG